jgi:hypothetical protein
MGIGYLHCIYHKQMQYGIYAIDQVEYSARRQDKIGRKGVTAGGPSQAT